MQEGDYSKRTRGKVYDQKVGVHHNPSAFWEQRTIDEPIKNRVNSYYYKVLSDAHVHAVRVLPSSFQIDIYRDPS